MAASGDRDWFRSPTWHPEIAARFEKRLRRARPANRGEYLRIQASHLLPAAEPDVRESGRRLLRRVIAEYPDGIGATTAWEQLGDSLAGDGRLDEAERALRETIRRCAASPTGRSGTTHVAELRLAEVILLGGDATRLDEAAELLRTVAPHVARQAMFRRVVFRFLLASARVAHRRGDPAAARLAGDALAVAAEATSSLPGVADAVRASASGDEVAELRRISDS